NIFEAKDDVRSWEFEKDGFNITYKSRMGAGGVTHTLPLSKKTSIRSTVAISGLSSEREGARLDPSNVSNVLTTDIDEVEKVKMAFTTALNHRFNKKHRVLAGASLYHDTDRLRVNQLSDDMDALSFMPYLTWQWSLSPRFRTEIGVNYFYDGFNSITSI